MASDSSEASEASVSDGGGTGVVVVWAGSGFNAAAVALIQKLGYRSRVVGLRDLVRQAPGVVFVVRDDDACAGVAAALGEVPIVVLTPSHRDLAEAVEDLSILRVADARALVEFARLLKGVAEPFAPSHERVPMTPREVTFVGTYLASGAPVATIAEQFVIAPNTLLDLRNRVRERYCTAGRMAGTNSELTLEMLADGWIQ
ncbi:MAG: hypothetical protein QM662_17090 [Gordonia sp. (in: high G+C Gram-positive bacteria)]